MTYRPDKILRIKAGLCFDCGDPKPPDTRALRCPTCAEKLRTRAKASQGLRYLKLKEQKLCVYCAVAPATHGVYCETCSETAKEVQLRQSPARSARQSDLLAQAQLTGQCARCQEPTVNGSAYCHIHFLENRARNKIRADKRAASPTCACGKPKVGEVHRCLACWIHYILTSAQLDRALAPALVTKWHAQDARCLYTGVPLIPGTNASLEHILPKRHHPELVNEISNLVWIDLVVNRAKRETPTTDFIAMCKQVVAREARILAAQPTPATLPPP